MKKTGTVLRVYTNTLLWLSSLNKHHKSEVEVDCLMHVQTQLRLTCHLPQLQKDRPQLSSSCCQELNVSLASWEITVYYYWIHIFLELTMNSQGPSLYQLHWKQPIEVLPPHVSACALLNAAGS